MSNVPVSLGPDWPTFPSPFVVPAHAAPPNKNGRSSPHELPKRRKFVRRTANGNRVLMYGRVRELALYRAAVLQDRGFSVMTPETLEDATAAIRKGGFDTVVLTYTLPNEVVRELAELVRQYCPDCPLVVISNERRMDREIGPDQMVKANDGPTALIAALRKVTRQN